MTKPFVAGQREADWSACLWASADLGGKDNPQGSRVPPKGSSIIKCFLSFRLFSWLTHQSSRAVLSGAQWTKWDPLALPRLITEIFLYTKCRRFGEFRIRYKQLFGFSPRAIFSAHSCQPGTGLKGVLISLIQPRGAFYSQTLSSWELWVPAEMEEMKERSCIPAETGHLF